MMQSFKGEKSTAQFLKVMTLPYRLVAQVKLASLAAIVVGAKVVAAPPYPAYAHRADGATWVSEHWQFPRLQVPAEPEPTETLGDALDAAYRNEPTLQAQRYELRATDEDYAQALAELRPKAELQVTGNYTKTVPGRATQLQRLRSGETTSPIATSNALGAEFIVDQPIYLGGKASADAATAEAGIFASREQLRATEGDILLRVITAYADVRRDTAIWGLRKASLIQLESTLYEVMARKEAGELTRTDIAQASSQLEAANATANLSEQQLQEGRSAFAALVGHDPGILAPEPDLPKLPTSLHEAFETALRLNPELAKAIATEQASRERISAAKAEGHPRLSLRGTARLGGQAAPFYLYNEDQEFAGQAVVTIPLWQGGRTSSLVEQAQDRNSADQARIEATRRALVQHVVDAWNAVSTAQRNLAVHEAQREAARILDEGTFAEYRAGLRSTFDVLFAHGAMRDAEIALVSTRRDLYVAQATLLRQIGLLEARSVLAETPLYDPSANTRAVTRRSALPIDTVLREFDRIGRATPSARGLEQPAQPLARPALIPGKQMPPAGIATTPALPPIGAPSSSVGIRP